MGYQDVWFTGTHSFSFITPALIHSQGGWHSHSGPACAKFWNPEKKQLQQSFRRSGETRSRIYQPAGRRSRFSSRQAPPLPPWR